LISSVHLQVSEEFDPPAGSVSAQVSSFEIKAMHKSTAIISSKRYRMGKIQPGYMNIIFFIFKLPLLTWK
jgi:hypothetical protein